MSNPHTPQILEMVRKQPHTFTYRDVGEACGLDSEQVRGIARVHNVQGLFRKSGSNRIKHEAERLGLNVHSVDHGWIKTEDASIHFRNDLPQIDIETLFAEHIKKCKQYSPKYKTIKRNKIKEGHLLVVDIADLHIGKLALAIETGEEYNIKIAKQRAIAGVEGLLHKSIGFPIDRILMVIGNDVLHIDNTSGSTTSGTPQDTDGMWHQIFNEALEIYVQIIERLISVADVDVVYNPSNHDYVSGYMLAQTVSVWFRKTKNISFDTSIRHRKHYMYGNNLITTSHGDGAKHTDMPYLMAHEHPEWSNKVNQKRYVYLHHLHHKKVTRWNSAHDTQGVHVQILRSPSAPDAWHDKKGYSSSPRAVEGFIHHHLHGQVACLTEYFS